MEWSYSLGINEISTMNANASQSCALEVLNLGATTSTMLAGLYFIAVIFIF